MVNVGFIVENFDCAQSAYPGISRKVYGQLSAMQHVGFECELRSVQPLQSVFAKIAKRLPMVGDGFEWEEVDTSGLDCLYIRRPWYASKGFLRFLKKAKSSNSSIVILLEVPAYPYEQEFAKRHFVFLNKDRKYRKELFRYVDRVVTFSSDEKIFQIPTIRTYNGIDLNQVQVREPSCSCKVINICCIAAFAKWHGIDRALKGLSKYYSAGGQRNVVLHLVGDGSELKHLWKMTKELNIEPYVEFYGQCGRAEMDAVYDKCTFAIASLGLHRIGISRASTLKTREYLAKGMPFVYSGDIDVFQNEPVDFCLQISADESPVDISALISFHDSLYERQAEEMLISQIRDYAERNVSMEKGMANVVEYIEENCGNE